MIQQVQREPVSHAIQHIDFHYIVMSQPIRVHIPIRIEGEAPAIKRDKGVLLHVLESVELEALPARLPEVLTLDISDMEELNSIRHVSDLNVPPRTLEVPVEVVEEAATPEAEAAPAEAPSEESQE